jgi:hypothetical protein
MYTFREFIIIKELLIFILLFDIKVTKIMRIYNYTLIMLHNLCKNLVFLIVYEFYLSYLKVLIIFLLCQPMHIL